MSTNEIIVPRHVRQGVLRQMLLTYRSYPSITGVRPPVQDEWLFFLSGSRWDDWSDTGQRLMLMDSDPMVGFHAAEMRVTYDSREGFISRLTNFPKAPETSRRLEMWEVRQAALRALDERDGYIYSARVTRRADAGTWDIKTLPPGTERYSEDTQRLNLAGERVVGTVDELTHAVELW